VKGRILMDRKKVTILAGGSSVEREISLKSAENLVDNLSTEKYIVTVTELPSDKNNTSWVMDIIKNKPDIVFSALHGGIGENGSVQGLLKCLNIPYIGSKVLSSALCMDKRMSKEVLKANHIQVAEQVFVERFDDFSKYTEQIKNLGFPVIVKPNRGGSSIGIEVVDRIEGAEAATLNIFEKYNDDVVIEKYIEGKEVAVFVIEGIGSLTATPVLDIKKSGEYFDYQEKYFNKENALQSTIPAFMQDMLVEMAKKAFKALKCSGYCCVDMIVVDERIYVIEVNTLPGITKTSLLPEGVKHINDDCGVKLGFDEFLDKMIDFELEKQ
jgi:D-alanine-D-alanine ligase